MWRRRRPPASIEEIIRSPFGFGDRSRMLNDGHHQLAFICHASYKRSRGFSNGIRDMKVSRETAAANREKIVDVASRLFREKGFDGIGVADLMKEAGLTHGGFYGHFDSREALVIEAFAYAMDRSMDHWRKISGEVAPEKRLTLIAEAYLSALHRDDPGHGCSIPALGAEIARESLKTRK